MLGYIRKVQAKESVKDKFVFVKAGLGGQASFKLVLWVVLLCISWYFEQNMFLAFGSKIIMPVAGPVCK